MGVLHSVILSNTYIKLQLADCLWKQLEPVLSKMCTAYDVLVLLAVKQCTTSLFHKHEYFLHVNDQFCLISFV